MKKVLNSFLDLNDYIISNRLSVTSYTLIEVAQNKNSLPQQYIFKTFRSSFHTSKDQKIILQAFYQFKNLKCQYLQIYDHFSFTSYDSYFYPIFSMKYISSTTLEQLLTNTDFDKKWNFGDVMKCLFAVAEGLSYLHDHLICHGNLCPSNIVLDEANQCYVCDFGLYTIKRVYYEQKDITNNIYKDPNVDNREPTFKSDVYSFGILMTQFFLLIFDTEKKESLRKFLQRKDKTKFNIFPKLFSELIQDCLKKDEIERPSFKKILKLLSNSKYTIERINIRYLYDEFSKNNYITNLANKGDSNALNELGEMYENGINFEKDYKLALENYEKAALLDNSEAQNNFGALLQKIPDQNNENAKKGAILLLISANQGNIHGMTNLGIALSNGKGVEVSVEKAEEYLKKSADQGSSYSQVYYALSLIENNSSIERNFEALKYIRMAINQGDSEAFFVYGKLLQDGKVVDKDEKLAMENFKIAADLGNVNAMVKYAEGCFNGVGVPVNLDLALYYYQLASNKGNKKADDMVSVIISGKNLIKSNQDKGNKFSHQMSQALKTQQNSQPSQNSQQLKSSQSSQNSQQLKSSQSPQGSQPLKNSMSSQNSQSSQNSNTPQTSQIIKSNLFSSSSYYSLSSSSSNDCLPLFQSPSKTDVISSPVKVGSFSESLHSSEPATQPLSIGSLNEAENDKHETASTTATTTSPLLKTKEPIVIEVLSSSSEFVTPSQSPNISKKILSPNASNKASLLSPNASNKASLLSPNASNKASLLSPNASNKASLLSPNASNKASLLSPNVQKQSSTSSNQSHPLNQLSSSQEKITAKSLDQENSNQNLTISTRNQKSSTTNTVIENQPKTSQLSSSQINKENLFKPFPIDDVYDSKTKKSNQSSTTSLIEQTKTKNNIPVSQTQQIQQKIFDTIFSKINSNKKSKLQSTENGQLSSELSNQQKNASAHSNQLPNVSSNGSTSKSEVEKSQIKKKPEVIVVSSSSSSDLMSPIQSPKNKNEISNSDFDEQTSYSSKKSSNNKEENAPMIIEVFSSSFSSDYDGDE